jgi:hypothetical protein
MLKNLKKQLVAGELKNVDMINKLMDITKNEMPKYGNLK